MVIGIKYEADNFGKDYEEIRRVGPWIYVFDKKNQNRWALNLSGAVKLFFYRGVWWRVDSVGNKLVVVLPRYYKPPKGFKKAKEQGPAPPKEKKKKKCIIQ